jgi:hypothetical protein
MSEMGMVERVARALIDSDNAEPFFACACLGKVREEDPACPCKMRAAERRASVAIMVIAAANGQSPSPSPGTTE